LTVTFAPES